VLPAISLVVISAILCQAAAGPVAKDDKCIPDRAGYKPGLHNLQLVDQGKTRRFLVFVPSKYHARARIPLWILAPGSYDSPETFLAQSGIVKLAEEKGFAFAALQGDQHLLNVGLHAQAIDELPDDVDYTKAVLRDVTQKLCVDMDRIRCAGFSRGARFCSRLASELSSFISGIGPVAGLRFPTPNNATRPVPIIAFHGTKDPINLYLGKGDPHYWESSVPDVLHKWADFNKCNKHQWERMSKHVSLSKHHDCSNDANVVLVLAEEGGHTWPGTNFDFNEEQFGATEKEIDANLMMWKFFLQHPGVSTCHDAEPGEPCHEAVTAAMKTGLKEHPEWKDLLSPESSFTEFQAVLHNGIWADCPKPCRPEAAAEGEEPGAAAGGAPAAPSPEPTTTSKQSVPAGASPPANPTDQALEPIQGRWTHKSDPGRFIEVVHGDKIRWDGGPMTKIISQGMHEFSTVWQGSQFHAHLLEAGAGEDRLKWDDGDVWIPAGAGRNDDKSQAPAEVEVKRIKDKGSYWQLPRGSEGQAPGEASRRGGVAGSTIQAILAAAGGVACLAAISRVFLFLWARERPSRRAGSCVAPSEEQMGQQDEQRLLAE
jgi:polyhydroxybutyrate depolymerase